MCMIEWRIINPLSTAVISGGLTDTHSPSMRRVPSEHLVQASRSISSPVPVGMGNFATAPTLKVQLGIRLGIRIGLGNFNWLT